MDKKQTSPIANTKPTTRPTMSPPASETAVRPTKKQRELLTFIDEFIQQHGYSPSYREIMNGLKYTSVATVALHINNLIKRGHLHKRDHSARSLEVVQANGNAAASAAVTTNLVKPNEEKWLVGKVEHLFTEAESDAIPSQAMLDDIAVMLAALHVLGLDGAVQSFRGRLEVLQKAAGSHSR